jgi:HlyD family secretion protein
VKRILIVAGVLALLGTILLASLKAGGKEKGVQVYAAPVERREIRQLVKASGELDPRVKVNISAHVIGKIEKLYVQEGDRIRKGQPFLSLEKEAFLAASDQWTAQRSKAETEVRQAEASLADSRTRLARARRLQEEGIGTTETLEQAQLAETSARLQLENAKQSIRLAQASLDKARDDLAKTTIYAPLSGRVIKLSAEQGEVVVSGTMNNPASVIGTIADLSEILANVAVDETEIVHVRVGQPAVLRVDAVPSREYHGKVVEVGSSGFSRPAQPDVTFFQVKVLLADADESLRPGMSVRAEIRTEAHVDALVVPIQAVVDRPPLGGDTARGERSSASDDEVKVVFAVVDGKARQRPVATGLADETHVELVSGAPAGEKVVTGPYRALKDLKDGDAVTISKTTETEDRKAARGNRGRGSAAGERR